MDDNMKAGEVFAAEKALGDGYYVVRLGKKKYQLLVIR
jgi:tyrosyl-tRNA synthetase